MSTSNPADASDETGPPSVVWAFARPADRKGLEHFDAREGNRALPGLHRTGAMTVARDRWERLESVIDMPYRRETVWRALTEPDKLAKWLAVSVCSLLQTDRDMVLDFEDGEYFLVRPVEVDPPGRLRYYARWLGIGQVTCVTWLLQDCGPETRVSVVEEATNPPWDWQTWNGGGWPGILEQLAAHLRTGLSWRWPWRRMGPYVQIELPVPVYPAWDQLFGPTSLKYWLIARAGQVLAGTTLPIMMGDASGTLEMIVDAVVGRGKHRRPFFRTWTIGCGGRRGIVKSAAAYGSSRRAGANVCCRLFTTTGKPCPVTCKNRSAAFSPVTGRKARAVRNRCSSSTFDR